MSVQQTIVPGELMHPPHILNFIIWTQEDVFYDSSVMTQNWKNWKSKRFFVIFELIIQWKAF